MKKVIIFVLITLLGIATFLTTRIVKADFDIHHNDQVKICHYTPDHYVVNTPDKSANVGGHNGHDNDIIPPFWYWNKQGKLWLYLYYSGKNWNAQGQEIWNNDCEIPQEPVFHSVCREDSCVQVEGEGDSTCKVDEDCVEVTITPTPTETPTPTPTEAPHTNPIIPAGAPVCNYPDVVNVPKYTVNNFKALGGGSVEVSWEVTDGNAQSYGIHFGTNEEVLQWYTEAPGHDTTSWTLNDLPKGNLFWQVCSVSACGQSVCGPVYDPVVR